MSWLMASMYDRFMRRSEAACLDRWREDLLRDLRGEVLEVGAGTGVNLPHYRNGVTRLVVSEPDAHMRRRLQARCGWSGMRGVEISDASLNALPNAAASFDAVVATLVLCSVPEPRAALAEVFRVLRPGGRFVFLEHVAAEEHSARLWWQRRLEPIWKHLAGNCHLTRRTEDVLVASGFVIDWIRRESIRKATPLVRASIRGVARKSFHGEDNDLTQAFGRRSGARADHWLRGDA
jgi:ubiquinone/menaquinone biosynthesis C-methylase UbiE